MDSEPVLLLELVKAVLVVLAFVLPIPEGFDVAAAGFLVALFAVLQRSKVTPWNGEL